MVDIRKPYNHLLTHWQIKPLIGEHLMSVGETALKVVITETVKGIWAAIPKAIDNWRFRRFFGVAAYEGNNIFGVVDPFSHPDPPHPKRYIKKFKGRRQGDAHENMRFITY